MSSDQIAAGAIPREPPFFQPRAGILADLDQAGITCPAAQVLTGPPGTGKTQLAAAYARAKLDAGWQLVAWVQAGSASTMLADLAEVAGAVGLPDGDPGRDTADPGRAVRQWLEADGDRCLLVLDDAKDPAALEPYLPACGGARVLVTSTRLGEADRGNNVPVGALPPQEAATFLTGHTGQADDNEAMAVAAELGYLPLALAQATAVIKAQNLAYRSYLKRLRGVPARREPVPGDQEEALVYPPGAMKAVLLSVDAIQMADESEMNTRVIAIMALLSAAGIRREVLYAAGQAGVLAPGGRPVAAVAVDDALAELTERSLLTPSLDGRTVAMHPMVAGATRSWLAERGQLPAASQVAVTALEAWARSIDVGRDRRAARDLPDQVTALLEHAVVPAGWAGGRLTRGLLRLRRLALYYLIELGHSEPQAATAGEPLAADLERTAAGQLPVDQPDADPGPEAASGAGPASGVTSVVGPEDGQAVGRPRVRRPVRLPWVAAAVLVLIVAGGAVGVLSRLHSADHSLGRARAVRSEPPNAAQMAADWTSQHVSRSATVACDPLMCAALEARGVPVARLLVLRTGIASPRGAAVVVATPAVRNQFGSLLDSEYAPSVLAGFGSGPDRVNVQVVAPDGAAAYRAALHQDQAARKAAGNQLLANKHIGATPRARTQLAVGAVDSRLLILLPALAATHPIQVLAFGDSGPRAGPGMPLCSADLSGSGRLAGMTDAGYQRWLTSFVRAQIARFAGSVSVLREGGQTVVRVQFTRPSPLGLLSG